MSFCLKQKDQKFKGDIKGPTHAKRRNPLGLRLCRRGPTRA